MEVNGDPDSGGIGGVQGGNSREENDLCRSSGIRFALNGNRRCG